jgi:hypothetical protein
MYFFLPSFSTSYSSILPHFILPSVSWSTSQFVVPKFIYNTLLGILFSSILPPILWKQKFASYRVSQLHSLTLLQCNPHPYTLISQVICSFQISNYKFSWISHIPVCATGSVRLIGLDMIIRKYRLRSSSPPFL